MKVKANVGNIVWLYGQIIKKLYIYIDNNKVVGHSIVDKKDKEGSFNSDVIINVPIIPIDTFVLDIDVQSISKELGLHDN